jgi:hypothetical protein
VKTLSYDKRVTYRHTHTCTALGCMHRCNSRGLLISISYSVCYRRIWGGMSDVCDRNTLFSLRNQVFFWVMNIIYYIANHCLWENSDSHPYLSFRQACAMNSWLLTFLEHYFPFLLIYSIFIFLLCEYTYTLPYILCHTKRNSSCWIK